MGKVIGIKTKTQLDKQDYEKNDKLVAEKGEYIGSLPKANTEAIRVFQDMLICEQRQIDELISEFEEHYKEYLKDIADILTYFKINPEGFNPENDKLMVGEDGHTWIVRGNG